MSKRYRVKPAPSVFHGSAAVPMADVQKVVIENGKGKEYVSVRV
ncbi:hypothetical protein [Streptomyces sp. NPDC057496]